MLAVSFLKLYKFIYKTLRLFHIQFDPEEIVDEEDQQFIIVHGTSTWRDFDVGDNSGNEECKCSLILDIYSCICMLN